MCIRDSLGVEITSDCPIVETPIRQIPDLFTGLHAAVVGIEREGEIFAPTPDDPLEVGDRAYIATQSAHSARLLEILGVRETKARHVVIIGGGSVGSYVAEALENTSGMRVRVIEHDKERAEKAAEQLTRTVILNGDAMDAEIQEEAGVSNAQMVISLTDNDSTNILLSLIHI